VISRPRVGVPLGRTAGGVRTGGVGAASDGPEGNADDVSEALDSVLGADAVSPFDDDVVNPLDDEVPDPGVNWPTTFGRSAWSSLLTPAHTTFQLSLGLGAPAAG